MRKLIVALFFIGGLSTTLQAECDEHAEDGEHFRLGVTGTAEFAEKPSWCEFWDTLDENTNLFPGLYWEVIPGHLGFGGTYLARFLHTDTGTGYRDWTIEWIGTMDLRYHFFKKFFLDPFVEASVGCAGMVDISEVLWDEDHVELISLSLFAQIGAGLAVRLDSFHIGAKLVYRLINDPIPATNIAEYPLQSFQASVFAGFSF
jgi:hypothetical protein